MNRRIAPRIAPRIANLTLCALVLAAALAAGCRTAPDEASAEPAPTAHRHAAHDLDGDGIAHYTCPMHPSVENAGPGTCPLCSMNLVPVRRENIESGEVVLDATRRQQIGVTTARAERRVLAVPVRAAGAVTYDQSRLTDVTVKVAGWIDELYADRLGQRVKEGEPLFTLYSEDLFQAQLAYLNAAENLANARKVRSPLISDLLLETRRQRLRLSDLGPEQLDRLDEHGLPLELVPILSPASGHVIEKNVVAGSVVAPRMRLLRIAGLDRVWVEAEVYESELPLIEVGDPATVTLRYLPGREFRGRVSFIYPWLDGATRTGRVRVELRNPDLALKPEMYAEVLFELDLGELLAVPEDAILYAGDRRYVFVDLGQGRLRPQAVEVGRQAGDWVEVLDGLEAGDTVVTSGNFLIAAEARLGLALEHWAPRRDGDDPAAPSPAGNGAHTGHDHAPAGGGGHDHASHDQDSPDHAPASGGDAHAGHDHHGSHR